MRYLILLLIAVTTWSCNPSRKLDKLNKKHPELLANFCKDTFPCVTTKVDTLTNIEYDFIEVQCPGYENIKNDTIWLTKNKTNFITGPAVVVTEYKTKTITKVIKDSAAIRSCELEVIRLTEKCKELSSQNVKLQNKVTTKNRWLMWLLVTLLLMIIANLLKRIK
jgi:hypothetical protein